MSVALNNPCLRNSVRRLSRRAVVAGSLGGIWLAATGQVSQNQQGASPVTQAEGTPVASPVSTGLGRWRGRSVRVGAWGGEVQAALRAVVFQRFAVETGCDVQEVTTDYRRLSTRLATQPPYADLLVVDPVWAATALDLDAVEPIAEDAVERAAIAPIPVTPGSVPAYTYAMVAAFRRDAVLRNDPPSDWAAWWDNDRYAGRRALPRQALATFEIALLADGVAPDQLYPLDQARAIESLTRVSAQIEDRWWEDGLEPVAWLARNRTDFAAAWHYRVVAGQRDGRDVDYVWNQGLLIADHWVIPKGALNQDVARDLMRFATSREVQAELARMIPLGPVTPAAFDVLNTAEARLLPTAPESVEHLVPFDARWWAEQQQEAGERFSTWLLEVAPDE